MTPSLVLVVVVFVLVIIGAVVTTTSPTDSTSSCAILEDRCHCTSDLLEFVCRTAGFTDVPLNLPYAITKLWVFFLLNFPKSRCELTQVKAVHWTWWLYKTKPCCNISCNIRDVAHFSRKTWGSFAEIHIGFGLSSQQFSLIHLLKLFIYFSINKFNTTYAFLFNLSIIYLIFFYIYCPILNDKHSKYQHISNIFVWFKDNLEHFN